MLPKRYRLPTPLIKGVIYRGRSVNSAALRIKWRWNRHPVSRATVVTALTVDKRATVRNRVKRQLREILRDVLPRLHPSADLVVFASKVAARKTFPELKQELFSMLKQSGLYKGLG